MDIFCGSFIFWQVSLVLNECVQNPYFKSMNNFILCIKPRQLENTMPFMDTFLHSSGKNGKQQTGAVSGADREKVGKKRNNESPDSAIPSRSGEAQRLGKPCPHA